MQNSKVFDACLKGNLLVVLSIGFVMVFLSTKQNITGSFGRTMKRQKECNYVKITLSLTLWCPNCLLIVYML